MDPRPEPEQPHHACNYPVPSTTSSSTQCASRSARSATRPRTSPAATIRHCPGRLPVGHAGAAASRPGRAPGARGSRRRPATRQPVSQPPRCYAPSALGGGGGRGEAGTDANDAERHAGCAPVHRRPGWKFRRQVRSPPHPDPLRPQGRRGKCAHAQHLRGHCLRVLLSARERCLLPRRLRRP